MPQVRCGEWLGGDVTCDGLAFVLGRWIGTRAWREDRIGAFDGPAHGAGWNVRQRLPVGLLDPA